MFLKISLPKYSCNVTWSYYYQHHHLHRRGDLWHDSMQILVNPEELAYDFNYYSLSLILD